MENKNVTTLTKIHLMGFNIPQGTNVLIFFLFLMIYCVTIFGNLLIITLVSYSRSLHSPMYFFLSQLSVSDILLSTDILPNMLHSFLTKETTLSFSDCISQFYFFCVSETLECLLLTVMCYDRYLAICKPLHYNLAMNSKLCSILIVACWILSVLVVLVHTLPISQLGFCGPPNTMDHFYCDLDPILQLSCSDTTIVQLEVTLLSFLFVVVPFLIIVVSYIYIIITILKIQSVTSRQKVFSTCSSHLTVVSLYYGTISCVYLIPRIGQSWNISKFLSILYTVFTPLINPIIYSLRNKDLKRAVDEIISRCFNLLLINNIIYSHALRRADTY